MEEKVRWCDICYSFEGKRVRATETIRFSVKEDGRRSRYARDLCEDHLKDELKVARKVGQSAISPK